MRIIAQPFFSAYLLACAPFLSIFDSIVDINPLQIDLLESERSISALDG
jgi:hypothetical protein